MYGIFFVLFSVLLGLSPQGLLRLRFFLSREPSKLGGTIPWRTCCVVLATVFLLKKPRSQILGVVLLGVLVLLLVVFCLVRQLVLVSHPP